jgi:hypothetical protein
MKTRNLSKKPTPYSPIPQVGMTLLQMLGTIGLLGLLGAWFFPVLLEWVRR